MAECEQIFREGDAERLTDIGIKRKTVIKEIDRLKKFKSPEPDKMYPRVLKECKNIASEPLENIFRKSLDS